MGLFLEIGNFFPAAGVVLLMLMSRFSSVNTYEPGCSRHLGLMNGQIKDYQIGANSVFSNDTDCQIKYARLFMSEGKAFCAGKEFFQKGHKNPWIQIDLGVETDITGVLTQGRSIYQEWITKFYLAISADAFKWDVIQDIYGNKKVFNGNIDSDNVRTNWLDKPVKARFVRLIILDWHKHPSLRLELMGCQECANIISGPGIGEITASSVGIWKRSFCKEIDGHFDSRSGWCGRHNTGNQWIQLDVGSPAKITGVVTKGRGDSGKKQWVSSYTVSYSNDTHLWYYYKETNHLIPKIFGGNMDKSTERRHYFNSPIVARFVRIHPKSWHNHISLRAGVLGCPIKTCEENYFRLNKLSTCIENLAWKKEVWTNDKRHFWKDWKYGHAVLAVDGLEDLTLPKCAVLDNYYSETPIWMVDLGKKQEIRGVSIVTWQGDGQDKLTNYRDYVLNLHKFAIYLSNTPKLEFDAELSNQPLCAAITRENNGIFHTHLNIECALNATRGRFVYISGYPVENRWNKIFNVILCEVYVY